MSHQYAHAATPAAVPGRAIQSSAQLMGCLLAEHPMTLGDDGLRRPQTCARFAAVGTSGKAKTGSATSFRVGAPSTKRRSIIPCSAGTFRDFVDRPHRSHRAQGHQVLADGGGALPRASERSLSSSLSLDHQRLNLDHCAVEHRLSGAQREVCRSK